MDTYEFTIVASGVDPEAENFEDAFFEAGCDDATIAFQRGMLILDFARESKSFIHALVSAVRDVVKAGAKIERIEPDPLVSLSDIAKRTGLTKAAISHYAHGQRAAGFPPPVSRITTDNPLWDWVDVARWMRSTHKADLSVDDVLAARAVKDCNFFIVAGRTKSHLSPRTRSSGKRTLVAA